MKRRFAEGDYRGALELAEQVLAANPDDPIAEAIADESRAELDPPSSIAIDIDEDAEELDEADLVALRASSVPPTPLVEPPTSAPPSAGGRPTAPPGVTRSSAAMSAVRAPSPPAPSFDELDGGWDAGTSERPPMDSEPPPTLSADATVAIRGNITTRLKALDATDPNAVESLARRMYDHFVENRYAEAIELADQILLLQPKERLALAIQSQSRTALARVLAIVVLVVPRAQLAGLPLDAKAQSILSWVDSTRSVQDIATAARLQVSDVLAILDELREQRIVVLGGTES